MKTVSDIFFSQREKLPGSQGFTLLELMVSVSIIALVFVSLFRMQSETIGLAEAGRFYTIAPILAEQVLGQIQVETGGSWKSGTKSGDFSESYPGYSWVCQVTEPSLDQVKELVSDVKGLKKIHIRILRARDGQGRKDQFYEVTTFRYASL